MDKKIFIENFKSAFNNNESSACVNFIMECHHNGDLRKYLPLVDRLFDIPERLDFHPEGNSGMHSLLTIGQLKSATPVERYAMLLHDLGKVVTFDEQVLACENKGIKVDYSDNFDANKAQKSIVSYKSLTKHYGHAEKGVSLVAEVSDFLEVPEYWKKLALVVCENHMEAHFINRKSPVEMYDYNYKIPNDCLKSFVKCCLADSMGRKIPAQNLEIVEEEAGSKLKKFLDVRRFMVKNPKLKGGDFAKAYHEEKNKKQKEAFENNILNVEKNDKIEYFPMIEINSQTSFFVELKKAINVSDSQVLVDFLRQNRENGNLGKYFSEFNKLFDVPEIKYFNSEGNTGDHTLLSIENFKDSSPRERFALMVHLLGKGGTYDQQVMEFLKKGVKINFSEAKSFKEMSVHMLKEKIKLSDLLHEYKSKGIQIDKNFVPNSEFIFKTINFRALTKHTGYAEKGASLVDKISDRLDVSDEWRNFAQIFCKYHTEGKSILGLKPENLYDFNKDIPNNYLKSFVSCCLADTQGRKGVDPESELARKSEAKEDVILSINKLLDVRKYMVKHPELSGKEFSESYKLYQKNQGRDVMKFLLKSHNRE